MFIIKFGGSLSTNPETIRKIFEIPEEISLNHVNYCLYKTFYVQI